MMRSFSRWLVLPMLAVFAGCASIPKEDATRAEIASDVGQAAANDAIGAMTQIVPPAQTTLSLERPATDSFGLALVAGLRARGYAVAEPVSRSPGKTRAAAAESENSHRGISFDYRIAEIGNSGIYGMTLYIGSIRLGRLYALDQERVEPAGEWTRSE
jgi:type IV secretion system protein TrbH